MNPDNQAILEAILGTGAKMQPSTMGTGITGDPSYTQQTGGQLPTMGNPLDANPSFMQTIQRFFGGPQSNSGNIPQSPIRHTVGRDSWSSGMGLDHGTIMNNIGLGGNR